MKWGFLGSSWNISYKKRLVQTHYQPKIYCNLCKEILGVPYVAPKCVGVMQSLDLRTDPIPIYVTCPLSLYPLTSSLEKWRWPWLVEWKDMKFVCLVYVFDCICSVCSSEGSCCHQSGYRSELQRVISAGRTIVVIQAKWTGVVRMINRCCRGRIKSSPFQNIPIVIVLVT